MLQGLKECLQLPDGWCGEDSLAPTTQMVEDANAFMGMLPDTLPKPTISVCEDGEISLDWISIKLKACLAVGFEGDGSYSYAVRINGKTSPGVVDDPGLKELPEDIIEAAAIMMTGEIEDDNT